MTVSPQILNDYVAFAQRLADATEPVIEKTFRSPLGVDDKGAVKGEIFDPVTAADREVETVIRAMIMQHYPDHGILGEEHGLYQSEADWLWTLDPIDGTRAFITGIPLWGTLIALSYEGNAEVGVLNQPYLKERYFGTRAGSFLQLRDGSLRALKTRRCTEPSEAIGATTTPDLFITDQEAGAFSRLKSETRYIRYGTDCYGYAMLAAGHVDFVCETGLAPYDIRALIPIVEGAGGVISTWTGSAPEAGGQILASATPQLHEALMTTLNRLQTV